MSVGFWFVGYDDDQPWEFFCGEESLTGVATPCAG